MQRTNETLDTLGRSLGAIQDASSEPKLAAMPLRIDDWRAKIMVQCAGRMEEVTLMRISATKSKDATGSEKIHKIYICYIFVDSPEIQVGHPWALDRQRRYHSFGEKQECGVI